MQNQAIIFIPKNKSQLPKVVSKTCCSGQPTYAKEAQNTTAPDIHFIKYSTAGNSTTYIKKLSPNNKTKEYLLNTILIVLLPT